MRETDKTNRRTGRQSKNVNVFVHHAQMCLHKHVSAPDNVSWFQKDQYSIPNKVTSFYKVYVKPIYSIVGLGKQTSSIARAARRELSAL